MENLFSFQRFEVVKFLCTHEHHRDRNSVKFIATHYVMDGSEFKSLSNVEVFSSLQLSKPALRLTHNPVNGSI